MMSKDVQHSAKIESHEKFWASLEQLTTHLRVWHHESGDIPEVLCEECQKLCLLLKEDYAQAVCADPRNAPRVQAIRQAYAETWSLLNSRMEFKLAESFWPQVHTCEDFFAHLAQSALVKDGDVLPRTEIEALQAQGLALQGLKVAMIGPGAIPYTLLAYAQAGAQVTAIDAYAPACRWLERWCHKLLPAGQYRVVEGWAEAQDYSSYDVVIVASMLLHRAKVLEAIEANPPRYVVMRTTSNRRPMSLLLPQPDATDMAGFTHAAFVAETQPPLHIGNFSLVYRYPIPHQSEPTA